MESCENAQTPLPRGSRTGSAMLPHVAPCVAFFRRGWHPCPSRRGKRLSGALWGNVPKDGSRDFGGVGEGRFWCRIKRWHHRKSHRPATRVGDCENGAVYRFYTVFRRISRGITFEGELPPVTSRMPKSPAVLGKFVASTMTSCEEMEEKHGR